MDTRILTEAGVRIGRVLADVATVGILAQRSVRQVELLASQLKAALARCI